MRILAALLFLAIQFYSYSQDIMSDAEAAFTAANYKEAYGLFKEASEQHIKDDEPVVYVQCNLMMAECKVQLGEPSEGNEIAANTITYLDRYFPGQNLVKGQALTLQGRSYLSLGRTDLALEYLDKAEALLGDHETLELATCLNDKGIAYLNNGNYELSLQNLERSLRIRRSELSSTDLQIGDSFNNLGRYHQDTENPLQALVYFNRAQKIYATKLGAEHPKTALVSNNLAFANASQGDFDEAVRLLESVRSNLDQKFSGDHERKAFNLLSLADIKYQANDFDEAQVYLAQALKMYVSLFGEKHPEVANCYFTMAKTYLKQELPKDAVEYYQKAIYANLLDQNYESIHDTPEIRDYFNAEGLLYALEGKAIALEVFHYEKSLNTSDLIAAIDSYEKCDELISVTRQIRQNEKDKISLGQTAKEIYENGIRLSVTLSQQTFKKKQYLEKAFQFCERSKSAVLLEAINETKAKSFAGIPQNLIELEDSLKAEIAFFEQQLAAGQDQERFKNLIFQYQSAYQDFIKDLETNYPAYYDLKYSQNIASVEEIVEELEDDATLLSYFLGENQIYVFQVNKRGLSVHTLPREENLESQASALRNAIKYQVAPTIISAAKALHSQLIPKKIGKPHQIIIIPDGILGTLPFEAFADPEVEAEGFANQNFLIEKYAIAYDYSATLLVNRKETDQSLAERVLLCAPINFDGNEVQMATLPDSESEVREIKLFFLANGQADVVTKQEASEALMKSDDLMDYKYLHFATHGQVNESKPELSRVFLFPTESEDGSLYAGEIYNLKINADLVTLSACETGLGKIAKGEGIVGLSRALQYAGAKNLIVSLWQVADKSTSDLMIKFYDQHLHNNYSGYHAALRQAKLHLLRSEEYANPYYWAPFILVGY